MPLGESAAGTKSEPWTPEVLEALLPLTAEDIILSPHYEAEARSRDFARWVDLAQRLVWQHGTEGALQRLNAHFAGAV